MPTYPIPRMTGAAKVRDNDVLLVASGYLRSSANRSCWPAQAELERMLSDIEGNRLKMDLGRTGVIKLPESETIRRWNATTRQWPIMHAVTYGVSRDQMMARQKSNHIQVAYAKTAEDADRIVGTKAATAQAIGMDVGLCGTRKNQQSWA